MKETELLQPVPPAAPTPLPPPCFETKVNSLSLSPAIPVGEDELEVAIQRLLSFERNLKSVFYVRNFSLMPQLQDGPKCGLVALSIATSITNNFVNVKDIFELAFARGFTKQGEIFDASALAILAEKLGFKAKLLDGGLKSHLSCIIKSLLNKCLLLVPYDADFNHAPCCKEGFKAHWAIISGFVIMEEKSGNEEDSDAIVIDSPKCNACITGANVYQQLYFSSYKEKTIIAKKKKNNDKTSVKGKVYLVGLQGKSRHIGLWPFDDLALSNNNLINFPSTRNPEMYVVPEGGVAKGLKGRAVLIEKC